MSGPCRAFGTISDRRKRWRRRTASSRGGNSSRERPRVPASASAPGELLTSLLREVSRSFYLTLRVLPRPVRAQIGLAYLLARTTDTIADTDVIPVAGRLRALEQLRRRILGEGSGECL